MYDAQRSMKESNLGTFLEEMSLTLKSIFAGLSPNPDLEISVNKIKHGIFCIFGCRHEILHKRNKSLNEKEGDVVWGAMREWGMVLSSNEFHGFVSRLIVCN